MPGKEIAQMKEEGGSVQQGRRMDGDLREMQTSRRSSSCGKKKLQKRRKKTPEK